MPPLAPPLYGWRRSSGVSQISLRLSVEHNSWVAIASSSLLWSLMVRQSPVPRLRIQN